MREPESMHGEIGREDLGPGYGERASQSEIRDLTVLARDLRRDFAPPEPRPAFVTSSANRVSREATGGLVPTRPLRPRRGVALASAALALTMAFGTTGLAFAAQGSLPGETLYGVKRGLEAVRMALSLTPAGDERLAEGFLEERLREALALAQSGEVVGLQQALDEFSTGVADLLALAEDAPNQGASDQLLHHTLVLEALLSSAPPAAQAGLLMAIERSTHGAEVLEALEQSLPPQDLAPGLSPSGTPGHPGGGPGGLGPHGNSGQGGKPATPTP